MFKYEWLSQGRPIGGSKSPERCKYEEKESMNMIRAGIIGSTGYAGGELARLLLQREDVEVKWYGSRSYIDKKYASIYQNYVQADRCGLYG